MEQPEKPKMFKILDCPDDFLRGLSLLLCLVIAGLYTYHYLNS